MLNNFNKKIRIQRFLFCFTLIVFGFSQDVSKDSKSNEDREKPLVSIHAEDTHLPSILAILASESGYNIVTGPNVQTQNKLTIHLDNVPIDQAVNLVIRAAGLSYEIVGNSILVANHSKIDEDIGITPEVISLQYSSAIEVAELLKKVTENVTIDPTGNKLLITASPKKIAEVNKIVEVIDVPSIQIMLEARIIEVSLNDEEKFGIDWEKLNQITLIFAESGVPQQLTKDLNTGSYLPGGTWTVVDPDPDEPGDEFLFENVPGTPIKQLPESMPFLRSSSPGVVRQASAFDVTLDMLLKDNNADIITKSQVVTVNGHEATIEMVDVIPYLASSGGIGNTNFQVQKESVGIKLSILPHVNTDGYITTKITPELSSIQSFTAQGYPWMKKRVSTTTVRVKDGETIIIAGLVNSQIIETEVKVPLLWRIPFFGRRFFTHTEEQEKKTDLIIEVKPSIIKDNYSGIIKQDYHLEAEDRALNVKKEVDIWEDDKTKDEESDKQ